MIRTKPTNKKYRDGWDKIFGEKKGFKSEKHCVFCDELDQKTLNCTTDKCSFKEKKN